MLWQTGPNPCDNHRHAFRKHDRGMQEKDEGTVQKERKNHNSKNLNCKKEVSLGASCSVVVGNGCYSSASIQQLVPNPLGRNASPILSLPAYATQQTACSMWLDGVSAVFCMHCTAAGAASGLMGQISAEVILDTLICYNTKAENNSY